MVGRRIGILTLAALLQPEFALADDGIDKARAMMIAMQREYCRTEPSPDDEWADRAWVLQWRDEFQAADEPDRKARLLRLYCDNGAYNVLHGWFVENEEGVSPLSFAMPAFDVSRETEEFDSAVTGIKATGFRSEIILVNSDYDPKSGRITMTSLWRGLGDAYSVGEWQVIEGEPVLKSFEVDASYDGEQSPTTLYKAE